MAALTVAYAKESMGEAEKEHAMETLAVGSVALETARIAEDKAQNVWVKKFAKYEVAEQTTIAEILRSMGATPAKLTDKQSEMITKAKEAKAGPSFDGDFLASQLDGHRNSSRSRRPISARGRMKPP